MFAKQSELVHDVLLINMQLWPFEFAWMQPIDNEIESLILFYPLIYPTYYITYCFHINCHFFWCKGLLVWTHKTIREQKSGLFFYHPGLEKYRKVFTLFSSVHFFTSSSHSGLAGLRVIVCNGRLPFALFSRPLDSTKSFWERDWALQ